MVGTTLGSYRLLNKLGAGGMGEVYRAHDERLQRDVAIKVLPSATFQDETARIRLLREARAAAALNHPAICTIYEVGEAGGHVYIAMELVDGRPLRDSTRGSGLPVTDVLRIGMQIADALAHAHARHIVHRDLKSANVVITADGRSKVLDFGLARRVAELDGSDADVETRATLTQPGTVVGTLAYMSPEQLRGEVADHRSDIWALGVVLYELATGRLPFTAPSGFELSSRILSEPPAPVPAAVPVALRAVIEKCLEKSRDRRYQGANEVRAALEAIQTGVTPTISTLRYQLSHRPWLAAAAIVTVVAVAGLLSIDRIRERWSGDGFSVESLAVLPLENLSGDATQEYFADGLTEVLSTDLARLGALKHVTARGSVMRYKGTTRAPADIARELNVDALVTGSMLRAGDRISITVQLLDPATGNQVWTNRYENDLRDVLTVRNEIVSAIVREIHAQLSPAERARLAVARPVNPEAFEAYLKGRFHWLKQTREDFDLAERYYQLAADKDPAYALAYAGLASVWMMRSDTGLLPSAETFPKASALMDKAFALDDNLPDLHVALGNHLATTQWDWDGAERAYRRAIELNSNSADGHFFLADVLLVTGRAAEWQREITRALELDPLNSFNRSFYGWHLNFRGRYDEAIAVFSELLPTGPNKASNYYGLWGAYYRKAEWAAAAAAARDYYLTIGDRAFADAIGIARDEASYRAGMRRAAVAMERRASERHVPANRIARMFAHAGDVQPALDWLERAYLQREGAMMRLGVSWDWLDLHDEPRFHDLMNRMKLPA
jgi:serine/threonine protein kinase/tetratricopeptide (TPR) repeat protein